MRPKMKSVLFYCLVALGALVWEMDIQRANASAIGCGEVIQGFCAGCSTTGNPSDTGCRCGVRGQACDCINTAGGLQSGIITECIIGDWAWTPIPPTYGLSASDPVSCGTAKACQWTTGSSTGCGTFNNGRCVISSGVSCTWKLVQTHSAPLISIVGPCE